MSNMSILDISAAGMNFEQSRFLTAAQHIAQANIPRRPALNAGSNVKPFSALIQGDAQSDETEVGVLPDRLVFDPNHPLANGKGMVAYPRIDMVSEMTTILDASRGYQANLAVMNSTIGMLQKSLDVGARR